jgi:hypothetical protein
MLTQLVQYATTVIETAAPLVGNMVVDDMIGPLLDTYLAHYMLTTDFKSPFPGQNTTSKLTLDYRNVQDPFIGDGYIEFRMLGEFLQRLPGKKGFKDCPMKP